MRVNEVREALLTGTQQEHWVETAIQAGTVRQRRVLAPFALESWTTDSPLTPAQPVINLKVRYLGQVE